MPGLMSGYIHAMNGEFSGGAQSATPGWARSSIARGGDVASLARKAGPSLHELAALNDKEPLQFLLSMLGEPQNLDRACWGGSAGDWQGLSVQGTIDAGRMRNVLLLAAARSGWRSPLPSRQARGIAAHYDLLTYIGTVARVAVADDGQVSVPRIDLAVDCGSVVDAEEVAQTFRRAVMKALSDTLHGPIRFGEDPDLLADVRIHIVRSSEPFGSTGDIATAPVMSATVNAIFAATGQRSRRLPINPALLKVH